MLFSRWVFCGPEMEKASEMECSCLNIPNHSPVDSGFYCLTMSATAVLRRTELIPFQHAI